METIQRHFTRVKFYRENFPPFIYVLTHCPKCHSVGLLPGFSCNVLLFHPPYPVRQRGQKEAKTDPNRQWNDVKQEKRLLQLHVLKWTN